jgi:hypothetical protein
MATTKVKKNMKTLETFTKAFPPGSVVFATTLNQDGIVQGGPNWKRAKFPFSEWVHALICVLGAAQTTEENSKSTEKEKLSQECGHCLRHQKR